MGEVTFTTTFEDGESKSVTATIFDELKFIAQFRRLDTYKGEFGFDWMRDNYKDICKNHEELKKEYTPDKIHEKDYFVPWLSMFPEQGEVKLKLEVDIISGEPTDLDVIKLPSKNGIKFSPDIIKVNEIKKNDEINEGDEVSEVEILVTCETPINENFDIELLDKNEKKVGKLNVLKNDEELALKIKFIKIKGNEIDNRYNDLTFGEDNMPNNWMPELINDLGNKYLNQALVKVEEDSIEEMIIDIDKYVEEGFLDAFVVNGKRGIPRYNKGFDKKLYEDFISKRNGEKYRGIVYFLSSMHQQGQELGHAFPYPRETNYILMTPSAVGGNELSYGHELGHTLGLHHPWETSDIYKTRLSKINERKEYLNEYLNKTNQYSDETKITGTNKTMKDTRERINKEILALDKEINDRTELTPVYTFNKSTTENIMDYNGYNTAEGKTINNPHSNGITFWKWQWLIINEEIKKYHG